MKDGAFLSLANTNTEAIKATQIGTPITIRAGFIYRPGGSAFLHCNLRHALSRSILWLG